MPKNAQPTTVKPELELFLLGAALAVILFLVDKTPFWMVLGLIALAVLLFYPVRQLPWIRNKRRRQAAAEALMAVCIIGLGLITWPNNAGMNLIRNAYARLEAQTQLQSMLTNPWLQRCFCFALGLILSYPLRHLMHRISIAARSRGTGIQSEEKGFLDYKMQAEEGMAASVPVLASISKITELVGTYMTIQGAKAQSRVNVPGRAQVRFVSRVARQLLRYTARLNAKSLKLKEISDSLIEGIDGWMRWMSVQKDAQQTAQQLSNQMTTFAETLHVTINSIDQYLATVKGIKGVSRDMNSAIETHYSAVKRVRDITEKLQKSCADAVRLLKPLVSISNQLEA